MKAVSGEDFAKLLEKKGWELQRTNGSHHIYVKAENPARISVPVHGNRLLKIGLLRYLMKVADIEESELCHETHNNAIEPDWPSATLQASRSLRAFAIKMEGIMKVKVYLEAIELYLEPVEDDTLPIANAEEVELVI